MITTVKELFDELKPLVGKLRNNELKLDAKVKISYNAEYADQSAILDDWEISSICPSSDGETLWIDIEPA
jgi:hypothetical protein